MGYDALGACAHFGIEGEVTYCERYGAGHINDTYLVKTTANGGKKQYILQRVNNKIFKDVPRLMNNIKLVTEYYFRVYLFIEDSAAYQIAENPEIFYQSAVAFGRFAAMLADFDASLLYESIPQFHDTKKRFNDLLNAIEENEAGRKDSVKAEIEFALARKDMTGKIVDKLASKEIPSRVTHNDTKLNNVLFDAKTNKALAVIDLDTIMPGSTCYDFGDSIRFGCNTAAEDEPNLDKVDFSLELFDVYAKGYLSELKGCLTEAELDNLPLGAIMMTYECGIRFLEDYLRGDVYFRTSRENHNLDRARTQFKLVSPMEKRLPEMQAIIRKYAK